MKYISIARNKTSLARLGLILITILFSALIHFQFVSAANTFYPYQYELVTNTADGLGILTNGTGKTGVNGVSADGSKILFTTTSANLPNNTSGQWAGFLRDMNTGTTERIDVTQNGTAPSHQGSNFVMSTTGRYVAFASYASDIVTTPSTDTYVQRIYFKDMQSNTTELITDISAPSVPNDGSLRPISISDDGRFIVILTGNINRLLPGTRTGDTSVRDIVMFDRTNQSWSALSKTHTGGAPSVNVAATSASCDGSLVLLESSATNLVNSHSGSGTHVFLADVRNGLHITDITSGATASSYSSDISCNGRYITYETLDRTLLSTPSGMNTTSGQAVRYDRLTGERKYIGSASNNTSYNSYSSTPYSVTDAGDALIVLGGNHIFYNYSVHFKHLSDGSGTLESIQGGGLNAYNASFRISSNGKYVVTSTQDAYALGLAVQNVSGSDRPRNVIRIKTGL